MAVRLDLGFNGNYNDSSGNGWNPTTIGANNAFGVGGISGGFLYNSNVGANSNFGLIYNNTQNIINFNIFSGFTYQGYFKISAAQRAATNTYMRLIEGVVVGPNFPGFGLFMQSVGQGNGMLARVTNNAGADIDVFNATAGATYADDSWHSFTFGCDGTNVYLYIDATLIGQAILVGTSGNPGTYSFGVGCASNIDNDVWQGALDGILIDDTPLPPLPPPVITTLYNGSFDPRLLGM